MPLDGPAQQALLPPYPYIREQVLRGQVIPFLGSGASHGSQPSPPSGQDLARMLADDSNFPPDEPRELAKVAEYWKVVIGRPGLRNKLHEIFCKGYQPAPVHLMLASLPGPILILTTNYDTLIEDAFKSHNQPFDLVVHSTTADHGNEDLLLWKHGAEKPEFVAANKLGPKLDIEKKTVLYKIHGTANHGDDQYLITQDDYVEFINRMPHRHGEAPLPAPFADAFTSRPLLFLGYGLRDLNLLVFLKRIQEFRLKRGKRAPGVETTISWAIQRGPSPFETRLWQEHKIDIFDIPIDEFCKNLHIP